MNTSSIKRLFELAVALLLMSYSLSEVNAYTQRASPAFKPRLATKTPTAIFAWSIPSAAFSTPMFSTASFGKSWYCEVNPTARRTVYDDAPLEYTFVSPGDDWPTSFDSTRENQTKPTRKRIDPLRRAANWVRGRKHQPE